jgi:hypothetical protein
MSVSTFPRLKLSELEGEVGVELLAGRRAPRDGKVLDVAPGRDQVGVPQVLLDLLEVLPGRHQEARIRVPGFVQCHPGRAGPPPRHSLRRRP